MCSVLSFGAHKDPNSTPRERNKEALRAFEIKEREPLEKREQNSLMVTYQYGTSQKVRGQANSLPGPLLRRTKKQKRVQFCDWCRKKKKIPLYSEKTPSCHKIVGTRVRSRNFEVRIYAKIFGCAFVSFSKAITKDRTPIGVDLGCL